MCYIAKNIYEIYYIYPHFFDENLCPVAFKPSIADRFIFKKIVDDNLDKINEISIYNPSYITGLSLGLLCRCYYPFYSEWKEMPTLFFEEEKFLF